MPNTLQNGYCTLADVHESLRLSDTNDDDRLIQCINAASRQIDNETTRRFWQDATPSSRIYAAYSPFLVEVDDFQTTTGFVLQTDPNGDGTFPVTWAVGDYQLEPLNAQYQGQPWVFDRIRAIMSKAFPVYGGVAYPQPYTQGLIKVTAQWGWTAIPEDIRKACILQSIKLFKADDVPFGATPAGESGILRLRPGFHPDAVDLIEPYKSTAVLVG